MSACKPNSLASLHLGGIHALMDASEARFHLASQIMSIDSNAKKPTAAELRKLATAADLATVPAAELASFGFSLTKLPSMAAKGQKKTKAEKVSIEWPIDVVRAASAMGVTLPDLAPVKGASQDGTLVATPAKPAKAAHAANPVRLPSQLDRTDAGPCWALYVACGGRFDADQTTQFADMSAGDKLPLTTLLATLNPAELSGKAFQVLYTGAGSQGILRTIAQYTGRTVTLSLADFTISLG